MMFFPMQAVCSKCGVDTINSRKQRIWLCKICSENKEVGGLLFVIIKKSWHPNRLTHVLKGSIMIVKLNQHETVYLVLLNLSLLFRLCIISKTVIYLHFGNTFVNVFLYCFILCTFLIMLVER